MKTQKIALSVLTLGMTSQVLAATTSTIDNVWDKFKKAPISADATLQSEVNKNKQNEVDGLNQLNLLFIKYKPTANDTFMMENRFTHTKTEKMDEWDNKYARLEFDYTRSNILTEAANGVSLSATLEQRIYPDNEIRAAAGDYGLTRAKATVAKGIGDLSLGLTGHFAVTQRKDKSVANEKAYTYFVASQGYNLTDKLNTSLVEELIYLHGTEGKANQMIDVTWDISYQATKRLGVSTYITNTTHAGENTFERTEKLFDSAVYGIALNISLF